MIIVIIVIIVVIITMIITTTTVIIYFWNNWNWFPPNIYKSTQINSNVGFEDKKNLPQNLSVQIRDQRTYDNKSGNVTQRHSGGS